MDLLDVSFNRSSWDKNITSCTHSFHSFQKVLASSNMTSFRGKSIVLLLIPMALKVLEAHAWTTMSPQKHHVQLSSVSSEALVQATKNASWNRSHDHSSPVNVRNRRQFLSQIIIGAIALPLTADASESSPAGQEVSSTSSTPSNKSSNQLDSFGQELNTLNFDAWNDVNVNAPTGSNQNDSKSESDNNNSVDLMNAIEEKKRKRAVGPRTHG